MPTDPRAEAPAAKTAAALEIAGPTAGLLDDPLPLRARGAGGQDGLLWRARFRDDEGRVWRASAPHAEQLTGAWAPAKAAATGSWAALASLRPVSIDVRVEAPDGRAGARTFARLLLAEGVRVRRWRDGLQATLYRPAEDVPRATVVIDATAGEEPAAAAVLVAALLASRGVMALAVASAPSGGAAESTIETARERLSAVPGATPTISVLRALDPLGAPPRAGDLLVGLPPGVARREREDEATHALRAAAWDALLALLGGRPRAAGSRGDADAGRKGLSFS